MQYTFPADLRARIDAQLALGTFSNEDDVIREAIDSLEKRQQRQRLLRQMVQDAEAEIAAGCVDSFNANATKDAVRQRLQQNGVRS
jgi:Arc/MetJ-type ribon-helix-helix transcriptional regulator